MIKISLVIPVYNAEKYLEKCLKSVITQTLKEIEIIIVNDGSKDKSLNIINDFFKKDKRIIIINKKNNEGVSKARNSALKIAKGEYILNIDSDDWIEDNYCEEIYEMAINNNLDIVVTDIFVEGKKQQYLKDLDIKSKDFITSKEYLEIFFKENLLGYTWNKLMRKKLYKDITYPENISLFEDIIVTSKLIKNAKKIGKINKAYYHYMENPTSISRKLNFSKIIDTYNCFKELKFIFSNEKNIYSYIEEQELYALIMVIVNSPIYKKNVEYTAILEYLLNCVKKVSVSKTDFRDNRNKRIQYFYYRILKLFPNRKLLKVVIVFNKNIKKLLKK